MENKINIKFNETLNFELDNNNPDLEKLIEIIVDNKDDINLEEIKVIAENPIFDSDGFLVFIKDLISDFLEKIKLEDIDYNSFKDQVDNI